VGSRKGMRPKDKVKDIRRSMSGHNRWYRKVVGKGCPRSAVRQQLREARLSPEKEFDLLTGRENAPERGRLRKERPTYSSAVLRWLWARKNRPELEDFIRKSMPNFLRVWVVQSVQSKLRKESLYPPRRNTADYSTEIVMVWQAALLDRDLARRLNEHFIGPYGGKWERVEKTYIQLDPALHGGCRWKPKITKTTVRTWEHPDPPRVLSDKDIPLFVEAMEVSRKTQNRVRRRQKMPTEWGGGYTHYWPNPRQTGYWARWVKLAQRHKMSIVLARARQGADPSIKELQEALSHDLWP
jgi:hypothetical protein